MPGGRLTTLRIRPTSGAHGRPLRARGHRTRSRLLAAGATVFAEKGFHAARVDDIVRAAESSHGTFYLYFVSKEDLFDQLIDEVTQEIAALVDELPKVTNSEKGRAALARLARSSSPISTSARAR